VPLLINEYDLSIDEKNRISIPAEVRKQLNPERDGEAFIATMTRDKHLALYPEKQYEQMSSRERSDITPSLEVLQFDRMNYSQAIRLVWDAQGRMGLTEKAMRRFALEKQVTLIGVRDHLELWNTTEWNQYMDALYAKTPEVAQMAKDARKAEAASPSANAS
jgi:MraZ protein